MTACPLCLLSLYAAKSVIYRPFRQADGQGNGRRNRASHDKRPRRPGRTMGKNRARSVAAARGVGKPPPRPAIRARGPQSCIGKQPQNLAPLFVAPVLDTGRRSGVITEIHPQSVMIGADARSRKRNGGSASVPKKSCRSAIDPIAVVAKISSSANLNRATGCNLQLSIGRSGSLDRS